ncbi:tail completion protein gp17 [Bacillus amyloliquefaciens]
MKLPIQEVEQSLSNNAELTSLVPDERIYMVYVPEENQVVENAPMIRINELESYRKDYADDEVQTISVDIQIDLWTKKIEEARIIQKIIDDIMADNDYQQYASAFDRDPDIELYRYARRYRATKYINLEL